LKELCATFFNHIEDLELRLKKAKCPPNTSTPNKTFELQAELKELTYAMGDKPTGGLTQVFWASGDRRAIPWDDINKLTEDDSGKTSSKEDNVKGAANATPSATSVEEEDVKGAAKANATFSKAKSAKLAKMAKSTDLWCLSPFVPLSQEVKAKQRKVCPVNFRGEVCTANNCGSKHPKVCLVADHGKGKIPKATCVLWHMQVPFAGKSQGKFTGRRSGPRPPPGSKGNSSINVRPAKPDKYLVKLKAEYRAEELKARIRATKMMLQGHPSDNKTYT
jgi:hypothetical protein